MHLKFLARGTGSAAAAAAYLLAKRDAAGRERAAVEVLRGDPREVAAIARRPSLQAPVHVGRGRVVSGRRPGPGRGRAFCPRYAELRKMSLVARSYFPGTFIVLVFVVCCAVVVSPGARPMVIVMSVRISSALSSIHDAVKA